MTTELATDRMAAARAARAANRTKPPESATEAAPSPEAIERASASRQTAEAAAIANAAPSGPTNNTRVANKLAEEQALRERAARQRVNQGEAAPDEMVKVRITKQGHNKVSMGEHVAGIGEAHYEWKEETSLARTCAEALEERGFVEIL